MNIDVIKLGPMDNCTYLVSQDAQALLIDPAWDMNFLLLHLLFVCSLFDKLENENFSILFFSN